MRPSLVVCLILALTLAPACKAPPDSNPPTGGCEDQGGEGDACAPESVGEHCADLDAQACGADPQCRAIEGHRLDADAGCREPASFTACAAVDQLCTAATVTMRDEGGSCWWFSSGCVPGEPWTQDDSCSDPSGERPMCGE